MPTVSHSWLGGNRADSNAFDQADAQNAAARDAAISQLNERNMRQQDRSWQRGMNQDTLNFNMWDRGQQREASALELAARRGMQSDSFAQEEKGWANTAATTAAGWRHDQERDDRAWNRDAPLRDLNMTALTNRSNLDAMNYKALQATADRAATATNAPRAANPVAPSTPRGQALATRLELAGSAPAEVDAALRELEVTEAGNRAPGLETELALQLHDLAGMETNAKRGWANPTRVFGDRLDPDEMQGAPGIRAEAVDTYMKLREAYQASQGDANAQATMRTHVLKTIRTLGLSPHAPEFAVDHPQLAALLQAFGIMASPPLSGLGENMVQTKARP
jgi:hypothetical protein